MVYVFVGLGKSPFFRILVKVSFHILVDFFLQINSHVSVCAYHDIRANAFICGNIAIRIVNSHIGGVINNLLFCQCIS